MKKLVNGVLKKQTRKDLKDTVLKANNNGIISEVNIHKGLDIITFII